MKSGYGDSSIIFPRVETEHLHMSTLQVWGLGLGFPIVLGIRLHCV